MTKIKVWYPEAGVIASEPVWIAVYGAWLHIERNLVLKDDRHLWC